MERETNRSESLGRHDITLRRDRVVLRPMTEDDWSILLKWNSDPDVLFFSEGATVTHYSLEQVQHIYRSVSQDAFCFIIEWAGMPIGECALQRMNLPRILAQHSGQDCRRIDLMIGDKALWGRGIGPEVVRLLVTFGFEQESADLIFACDVADYNLRSLNMFRKAGFELVETVAQPAGSKARHCYDLALTRQKYQQSRD